MHCLCLGRLQVFLGTHTVDRIPVDGPHTNLRSLPYIAENLAGIALGLVNPALVEIECNWPLLYILSDSSMSGFCAFQDVFDLGATIVATWLTAGGTPLNVVQQLLGHKNIETTMRYAHADVQTVTHFLDQKIGATGIEAPNRDLNPNNKATKSGPSRSLSLIHI